MKYSEMFIHDFETDLAWSECPAQYVTYMQAVVYWWQDAVGWNRIVDLLQQRKGKDITISLPDGRSVNLQFKSRRSNYGDMCIEYRHDRYDGTQIPGWIEKESDADYLIYCVPEYAYRLDYKSLHSAWSRRRNDWIAQYDIPPSLNRDYETRNVGVPWVVLEQENVEIDSLHINPAPRPPPKPTNEINWPTYPSIGKPLFKREQYEEWISERKGTKEQLERYSQAISWYDTNKS